MRHSIAGRATVVGTSLRAIASIFGTANNGFTLREVGITNTTAVAVTLCLARFTNATGVGAGLTEADYDPDFPAICTGFAGHTADGAIGQVFRQLTLPAQVGAFIAFPFGDNGIRVAKGTANGIGIIVPVGTGQIVDYYYDWDE